MRHDLEVFDDVESLAAAGADYVASFARATLASAATFSLAVSGGKSPWIMLNQLAREDLAWSRITIYQVDERVVDETDDGRNLNHLRECLASTEVSIEAMDVQAPDPQDACRRYAALLPATFDLVHLGLGPDGHCASLVPDDPVLKVKDRLVAMSGPYQGARRMTLTYPALARSRQLLWLVSGDDKRDALQRLLEGDTSIPAGRVESNSSLIMAERAAMTP